MTKTLKEGLALILFVNVILFSSLAVEQAINVINIETFFWKAFIFILIYPLSIFFLGTLAALVFDTIESIVEETLRQLRSTYDK